MSNSMTSPNSPVAVIPIKSVNHYAYLLMAARNLALAEEKGYPLCTLCSACCGALTEANHEIQEDAELRRRINEDLSRLDRQRV